MTGRKDAKMESAGVILVATNEKTHRRGETRKKVNPENRMRKQGERGDGKEGYL